MLLMKLIKSELLQGKNHRRSVALLEELSGGSTCEKCLKEFGI